MRREERVRIGEVENKTGKRNKKGKMAYKKENIKGMNYAVPKLQ